MVSRLRGNDERGQSLICGNDESVCEYRGGQKKLKLLGYFVFDFTNACQYFL